MTHKIIYNLEEQIIEMEAQEDISLSEARVIISELAQAVQEHGCDLVLSDYRQATFDYSVFDIYELPKKISGTAVAKELSIHNIKRAIVVAKVSEKLRFLETVTLNSGQSAKVFHDIDMAKSWLYEK